MKDNLINESVIVKVKDRKYKIGELPLTQTLQLTKFLIKALVANKNKMAQLKERTKDSPTNADDVMIILDLLEESDVVRFFGIILKEDDHKWLANALGLKETLEIVTALCSAMTSRTYKEIFKS